MDQPSFDIRERPRLIVWETTPTDNLAGRRPQALPEDDPFILSFTEGCALVDEIERFGPPLPSLVLTGGDLFQRADLFDLVHYAVGKRLAVAVSLPGTALLTAASLQRLKQAGAQAVILTLDGSTPELHDSLQQMPESFTWTTSGARAVQEIGLKLQITSTVTRANLFDLPKLFALVRSLAAATWSISLPGPGDWAHSEDTIAPDDYEAVLNFLYDAGQFIRIAPASGRHYKRVVLQRMVLEAWSLPAERYMRLNDTYRRLKAGLYAVTWGQGRPPQAGRTHRSLQPTSAARDDIFIAHQGDVFPASDRSRKAGNVREAALVDTYHQSSLFQTPPQDNPRLVGRCGRCEFRWMCGAAQSWLNVLTGGSWDEPICAYEPGTFPFVSDVFALAGITWKG